MTCALGVGLRVGTISLMLRQLQLSWSDRGGDVARSLGALFLHFGLPFLDIGFNFFDEHAEEFVPDRALGQ